MKTSSILPTNFRCFTAVCAMMWALAFALGCFVVSNWFAWGVFALLIVLSFTGGTNLAEIIKALPSAQQSQNNPNSP
jgi:hypothetical protein